MAMFFFMIAIFLVPLTSFGQSVYFKADGESGQVKPPWGGIGTYSKSDYVISSTDRARYGKRSYKHYIAKPGDQANKADVWYFPKKPQAYFSTWYYLAQGYDDTQWRNNFQFKTDNLNTTVKGGPKIIVGFEIVNGIRQVTVNIRGCASVGRPKPKFTGVTDVATGDDCKLRKNTPKAVSKNQWFHLEAFLKASKTNGQLVFWQDGVEIFNLSHPDFDTLTTWGVDQPTKRSDNTHLYWLVSNYVSINAVGSQVMYTDDAMITNYRVSTSGQASTLAPPTNLKIISGTP